MKELIFKSILAPFYNYAYKNSNKIEQYKKLRKRNSLSCEDLYFIQWKRLKNLINYCYKNIPYYELLFKKLDIHPNDINSLKDYKQIPEIDKTIIAKNKDNLINPKLNNKKLKSNFIGGTNGVPSKIFRSDKDQEYIWALRARANSWAGWNYCDKSYLLISDNKHLKRDSFYLDCFSELVNRKFIANTKNISTINMLSWSKQIMTFRPRFLYGYSSLLEEFAQFLLDENIKIQGIDAIFTIIEPLEQRELIARAFKAPVYNEYGYPETPCIAQECSCGKLHINIDENLVEFVEESDYFQFKKVICTPLYSYGMPLLRYNTQDSAIYIKEHAKCSCGLPYPAIELKVERTSDNLISNNGKVVSGLVISSFLSEINTEIKQFQVIQKDLFNITIKLCVNNSPKHKIEKDIRKLFCELMDSKLIKINFEYYEKIAPDRNGNFKAIISNISSNDNYRANLRSNTINI